MKKHRFTGLLITTVFLAFVVAVAGQARPTDGLFDLERTKAILTGLIEKTLKEDGVPSISIALVRGDAIVWTAAFGQANVRTRTPATPDTLYNAASTFKAVTATAVMQLVEQGRADLNQPVNRYLGESPIRDRLQGGTPVTLTHLLSHWSGLTSWPDRGEAAMKPVWGRELPKPLTEIASEIYAIRPPETRFEYNNYGYGLAGLLVEKISGTEYERYVGEQVLAPLGITTYHPLSPSPDMVELMALPYEVADATKPPHPVPQVHTDAYPAGNAYLTAEDMARFLGAQVNGGSFQGHRILSAASVTTMHEPRFDGNYAFGFRVRKTPGGNTMIRHTGRLPGMSSMMLGDVDAHVGVYYMANATDVTAEIGDAAIALLRGEPYPAEERRFIQLDPAILERYVGTYQIGQDTVAISREGRTLFVDKNGRGKTAALLAESPTTFFLKGDPATVTFRMNAAGVVDRMEIVQADWQLVSGIRRNH